jgi:hypothetical protein
MHVKELVSGLNHGAREHFTVVGRFDKQRAAVFIFVRGAILLELAVGNNHCARIEG